MNESYLYNWCLEQAIARFMGNLTQEQEDHLNELGFPWDVYEEKLDELGFRWARNNPHGVRWKDTRKGRAICGEGKL